MTGGTVTLTNAPGSALSFSGQLRVLAAGGPAAMRRAAEAARAQGTPGYDTRGKAMRRTAEVLLRAHLRGVAA